MIWFLTPFLFLKLHPDVLKDKAAILGVLKHELHEIAGMRKVLADGRRLSGESVHGLLNPNPAQGPLGLLHREAMDLENAIVDQFLGGF